MIKPFVVFVVALTFLATAEAQSTPSATPAVAPATGTPASATTADQGGEEAFRIGVHVDLVSLVFTATDKHGRFLNNLRLSDIRLLDEGKAPARIEAFESETNLPLRVGLLIDSSNSIRERFRFEQQAASEFLHQSIRPKTDRAFVVGFDERSTVTQDYTDDTEALAKGVNVLRPGGGTALHDAVFAACEKLQHAPATGAVRKAIVLLSDGDDNVSQHTQDEAVDAALRAEVTLYVISTDTTGENKRGERELTRYAEATGGRVLKLHRAEEVADAFYQIEDELRSQYVIAYRPADFTADGRFHSVTLTTAAHDNPIHLRTRKGYYAPKE